MKADLQTEPNPRRSRLSLSPKTLILSTTVIIVAFLALVPLLFLLWGTFVDDGRFSMSSFRSAYETDGLGELVVNSSLFAFGATVVSISIGTFLAFMTERTDIAFKRVVFACALMPLILPGILYTIAWIFLASERIGVINQLLSPIFGSSILNVFSIAGMVMVEGTAEAPVAFLLMVAAFRSMDPSLEESAMTSGVPMRTLFWRITLPLARPALFGAFLLLLVRNFQAFEAPALLGLPNGIWMFTSRIWLALNQLPADYGSAGALSLSLLAITTLGMYIYYRSVSRQKQFQTVTGKGYRPRTLPLGKWRGPATFAIGLFFVFGLLLPVFILVYMSTQSFYSTPSWTTLSNMTWDNYTYVLEFPTALRSLRNSIVLSIGAGAFVMLLSAVSSWLTVKTKLRGRWLLDNLMTLPLAMPGLVIGVALLFVYLRVPIPIYGTMWILLIAYTTNKLPYGMRYATASMHQIGNELEESAATSGATWFEIFRRVHLPLLFPGLFAGFLYVLLTTMRELGSSLLLYSPGSEVVSTMIWEMYQNGQFTELAALGTMLIAFLIAIVFVAQRLARRFGVRSQQDQLGMVEPVE
jgi:iron(III) transport system permease protein